MSKKKASKKSSAKRSTKKAADAPAAAPEQSAFAPEPTKAEEKAQGGHHESPIDIKREIAGEK